MRRKNEHPGEGTPRRFEPNRPATKQAVAADISEAAASSNQPVHNRVLIDRFGHLHTRNVLRIWPDAVKVAMGLKFVDSSELGAGNAHPR